MHRISAPAGNTRVLARPSGTRARVVRRAASADATAAPPADLVIVTAEATGGSAQLLEKKRSRRFKEARAKVRRAWAANRGLGEEGERGCLWRPPLCRLCGPLRQSTPVQDAQGWNARPGRENGRGEGLVRAGAGTHRESAGRRSHVSPPTNPLHT